MANDLEQKVKTHTSTGINWDRVVMTVIGATIGAVGAGLLGRLCGYVTGANLCGGVVYSPEVYNQPGMEAAKQIMYNATNIGTFIGASAGAFFGGLITFLECGGEENKRTTYVGEDRKFCEYSGRGF